ncbi:hypothetical protein [Streptomyces sp. NPDC097981]|uniref:hypothetical protein n=1 Tax=Streptomyces sp. NPDC097981 TaxID=3155428 RepID=UPI00332B1E8F
MCACPILGTGSPPPNALPAGLANLSGRPCPLNPRDPRAFCDDLADRYDLLYADRDAGIARQGKALNGLLTPLPDPGPHRVLDNACGIGTRAPGPATPSHRATGPPGPA